MQDFEILELQNMKMNQSIKAEQQLAAFSPTGNINSV